MRSARSPARGRYMSALLCSAERTYMIMGRGGLRPASKSERMDRMASAGVPGDDHKELK